MNLIQQLEKERLQVVLLTPHWRTIHDDRQALSFSHSCDFQ